LGRCCNRGTLSDSHRMAARLGGHGLGALDQTRLSARALGAILNIHLSDVGPHAISLSHSGGVDTSWVRNAGRNALQAAARSQFHPNNAFVARP
jgi:hypothetical protein